MRCLVTGASGFLGSHLVRELLARQHSVVVLLRPGSHTERLQDCLSRISIVYGSLQDTSELRRALQYEPVEATFHLAWSGVTAEDRNGTEQITDNVTHSLKLWEVLRDTGCKVLIGVGSQAEYGPHPEALREDTPTIPITSYGTAKLALGILLKQLCATTEMRFVWLRLFSAYGPGDDERHMIPRLIRTLMRHEKPALTAGDQVWDYLYVTDAANALCASLESKATGIFNLASGTPCVLRKFISQVRDHIDPSLPLGFGEVPYRCDQVMNLSTDISRLKAATGWSPEVSIPEGIRKAIEWYRKPPKSAPILLQKTADYAFVDGE